MGYTMVSISKILNSLYPAYDIVNYFDVSTFLIQWYALTKPLLVHTVIGAVLATACCSSVSLGGGRKVA